ncbi:MAG: hypothetical protein P8Z80_09310 [Pseudolabrys sp.]
MRRGGAVVTLLGLGLLLSGCGSTSLNSMTGGLLGSSSSDTGVPAAGAPGATGPQTAAEADLPCPDTGVLTGASTLIVGRGADGGAPTPLDVRYQGSISRIDRECHVFAGMMHIKVGVEGRIVTGPAGSPGSINVPLRVAVVRQGIKPVTVATQLDEVPVTITSAVANTTFTHIYQDVSFPLPRPIGVIGDYKIFVGFDAIGAQKKKRPVRHRRRAPRRR